MTDAGKSSADTDWFLSRLYDLPAASACSRLVAKISRYVIDLNRSADGVSLYPGQTTTGLIPLERFDGRPIYVDPEQAQATTENRIQSYWQPYHLKIRSELDRLVDQHGYAILLEAHSIASEVPRLFEGKLPDFNLGTNRGDSCDSGLTQQVENVLRDQSEYSWVTNGRFLGGHITRHYGEPHRGCHALQIELSQATYLDESTGTWDTARADTVRQTLSRIVTAIQQWKPTR